MGDIVFEHINKRYGAVEVFKDFGFTFFEGKVSCILAPSGTGKTTLLNLAAGIVKPDSGTVSGRPDRISYVFQEDRLMPWLTAARNIEFVLGDITDKKERQKIAAERIAEAGLAGVGGMYPHEMSGGMRRRLAIVRAFAYSSELLLMDEPFKSLDKDTKNGMIELFLKCRKKDKRTVLLVTHDEEEARTAGDSVYMFSGRPFAAT